MKPLEINIKTFPKKFPLWIHIGVIGGLLGLCFMGPMISWVVWFIAIILSAITSIPLPLSWLLISIVFIIVIYTIMYFYNKKPSK